MDGDGIAGSSLGFTSCQTLGCCWQKGRGTPPPPLLPKISDGAREVYTTKGWFGAQCSFSGFSISFNGGGGGHLGWVWGLSLEGVRWTELPPGSEP